MRLGFSFFKQQTGLSAFKLPFDTIGKAFATICLLIAVIESALSQPLTDNLNQNSEPAYQFINSNDEFNSRVYSCFQASNGSTYFGSASVYFYQNKKVKYVNSTYHCTLELGNVFEIAEDDLGHLWFGQQENTIGILRNDSIVAYAYNDTLTKYLGRNNYFHNIYVQNRSLFTSNLIKGINAIDTNGNWNDSLFAPRPLKDTVDVELLCLKRGVVAGEKPRPENPTRLRIQVKAHPDAPVKSFFFPFEANGKYGTTSRRFGTKIRNKLFICVDSRVYQIEGDQAKEIIDLQQPINSITSDRFGRLWVCTGNGAYLYGPDDYSRLTFHWFKGEDLIV